MTFSLAAMIAVSFWSARGYDPPRDIHPLPISAAEASAYDARDLPDGEVSYMRSDFERHAILITPDGRQLRIWDNEDGGSTYCTAVVHEYGHFVLTAAGVPVEQQHVRHGVMRADIYSAYAPWGCRHPHEWQSRHRPPAQEHFWTWRPSVRRIGAEVSSAVAARRPTRSTTR